MGNIINVLCEGQSESAFVNYVLLPYMGEISAWRIILNSITLTTSQDRDAGRIYKGGLISYQKSLRDLRNCVSQGKPITTMFDFYRLPNDFPGYDESQKINSDYDRVMYLEKRLKEDILDKNPEVRSDYFIPYIQLHEFEALFFSDLQKMKSVYLSDRDQQAIDKLHYDTMDILPEDVDGGDETAPSKRLMNAIRYKKGQAVTIPLKKIGVDIMRNKCPHFNEWIQKILEIV